MRRLIYSIRYETLRREEEEEEEEEATLEAACSGFVPRAICLTREENRDNQETVSRSTTVKSLRQKFKYIAHFEQIKGMDQTGYKCFNCNFLFLCFSLGGWLVLFFGHRAFLCVSSHQINIDARALGSDLDSAVRWFALRLPRLKIHPHKPH